MPRKDHNYIEPTYQFNNPPPCFCPYFLCHVCQSIVFVSLSGGLLAFRSVSLHPSNSVCPSVFQSASSLISFFFFPSFFPLLSSTYPPSSSSSLPPLPPPLILIFLGSLRLFLSLCLSLCKSLSLSPRLSLSLSLLSLDMTCHDNDYVPVSESKDASQG